MKVFTIPAKELLDLLNRALNTLEPQLQPEWALPLTDYLEKEGNVVCLTTSAPK